MLQLNVEEFSSVAVSRDHPHTRRSASEVARRALVLCCVAAVDEFPPGEFNGWLKRWGLWEELSPLEADLFTNPAPDEQCVINATWRSEALQILLWSLGKIDELLPMTKLVQLSTLLDIMRSPGTSTAGFIADATLRPDAEIDRELATAIAAHDRLKASVNGSKPIEGVVLERWETLQWMVNAHGRAWDNIDLE
jgi:hypothetical protein